jgi:uncharacterized membrane protein YeaQ/YmgE (transglycosylase-associated protein family)
MYWIVTIIVGGIVGWLASMLMKTDKKWRGSRGRPLAVMVFC